MRRRPPRSTRTDTLFPYRRSSDLFTPITTRWMDNDVYGHVNNVVYYSWFDTAVNGLLSAEGIAGADRSEEHTSELQSLMRISSAVFCLTKKKHHIKRRMLQLHP